MMASSAVTKSANKDGLLATLQFSDINRPSTNSRRRSGRGVVLALVQEQKSLVKADILGHEFTTIKSRYADNGNGGEAKLE